MLSLCVKTQPFSGLKTRTYSVPNFSLATMATVAQRKKGGLAIHRTHIFLVVALLRK